MTGSRFISFGFVLALGVISLPQQGSCQTGSDTSSGSSMNRGANEEAGSVVTTGIWGGEHIRIEVTGNGALVEYDCAHGSISEPLKLDNEGRFQAKGSHVREHGGPIRDGETPVGHPATYSGSISGKTMTLTVTLANSSEAIGTFTLVHGSEGELVKCR